jgi:hypothetical protein
LNKAAGLTDMDYEKVKKLTGLTDEELKAIKH